MDENFDTCCEFCVKSLEGPPTDDPTDPGGFTIWGLARKYHPEITRDTTYEQAKKIYRAQYWRPDCNVAPWPVDLVLFDGNINPQNDPRLPGSGNQELISLLGYWEGTDPYQYAFAFLVKRASRYARVSNEKYVRGHVQRCERVLDFILKRRIPK